MFPNFPSWLTPGPRLLLAQHEISREIPVSGVHCCNSLMGRGRPQGLCRGSSVQASSSSSALYTAHLGSRVIRRGFASSATRVETFHFIHLVCFFFFASILSVWIFPACTMFTPESHGLEHGPEGSFVLVTPISGWCTKGQLRSDRRWQASVSQGTTYHDPDENPARVY